MERWTIEEFKMLAENLIGQDIGYKILQLNNDEYLICNGNSKIATYNVNTGLINGRYKNNSKSKFENLS